MSLSSSVQPHTPKSRHMGAVQAFTYPLQQEQLRWAGYQVSCDSGRENGEEEEEK